MDMMRERRDNHTRHTQIIAGATRGRRRGGGAPPHAHAQMAALGASPSPRPDSTVLDAEHGIDKGGGERPRGVRARKPQRPSPREPRRSLHAKEASPHARATRMRFLQRGRHVRLPSRSLR